MSILPVLEKYMELEPYHIHYLLDIVPIIDNLVAEDVARKMKNKKGSKNG